MTATVVSIVSIVLIAIAVFGVTLPLGTLLNDPVKPAPFGLGRLVSLEHEFQYHTCGCNNSWPLATDERLVSNAIFAQTTSVPDARSLTSLAAFWGQFMDHDVVLSETDMTLGTFTVQMSPTTAILTMFRNKVRWVDYTLELSCREPSTKNSPEIDASTVYGDYFKPELLALLRADNGRACKLRTSPGNFLPLSETHPNEFLAGDERSTEHSILTAMHTLWMREHNRLCDAVFAERPYFSEEQAFWKARQIVIAKIQHITYEEWLPALLGSQITLLDTVQPKRADTRISVEFSTAAFRIGHSLIPDPIGQFTLPSIFFNTTMMYGYGVDAFLEAAYETPAQAADRFVVDGLRNFLFAAGPMQMGEDLISRNLFRGRELGMSTYAEVAQCFHVSLQNEYAELLPGLFSEAVEPGSSLPKTIAVILAEQFKRLRMFDPNFYTKHAEDIGSIFYAQVLSTTLASVIRDNTGLTTVDNVFFLAK
jgi:peroxidase